MVWSGNPFSVYTVAEQVWISGEQVYVRGKLEPRTDFELGYRPGDLESTPSPATANGKGAP